MRFINSILLMMLTLGSIPHNSQAAEGPRKSVLYVAQQVEFPGTVLEPGKYIVSARASAAKRNTVQILNLDETQVLATILAVPDHRKRPDADVEFSYHQVEEGPRPLQSWYYSNDPVGLEFVYPAPRAREIAKGGADHVMAADSHGVITAVAPSGREIVVDTPSQPLRAAGQKSR